MKVEDYDKNQKILQYILMKPCGNRGLRSDILRSFLYILSASKEVKVICVENQKC